MSESPVFRATKWADLRAAVISSPGKGMVSFARQRGLVRSPQEPQAQNIVFLRQQFLIFRVRQMPVYFKQLSLLRATSKTHSSQNVFHKSKCVVSPCTVCLGVIKYSKMANKLFRSWEKGLLHTAIKALSKARV